VAFFAVVVVGIRRAMLSFADKDDERRQLGRVLLATLIGILVIIFTVSSITFIPVVYWSIAGLGVAYIQMVRRLHNSQVMELAEPDLQPR
jgi:FtsH-binding integral membrane protein